jgi:hypothetical protein
MLYLLTVLHIHRGQFDPYQRGDGLHGRELAKACGIDRIAEYPRSRYAWRNLSEQLHQFSARTKLSQEEPGDVASGAGQAC